MTEIKFTKEGFFLFTKDGGNKFIYFKEIKDIVPYNKKYFINENIECRGYEKSILEKWIEYHENNINLEKKLDKLFEMIEVLPGGEEYEKAKEDFSKCKDEI